jgi:hypothetical protein
MFALLPTPEASERTPAELVAAFFGPHGIEDKRKVYMGEMLERYTDEPTLGESLPEDIEIESHVLEQEPKRVIYAVTLEKDRKSQD